MKYVNTLKNPASVIFYAIKSNVNYIWNVLINNYCFDHLIFIYQTRII